MPLPEGFNPTEHLQDTIRRTYNREVRQYFRDVGDDNWQLDIATARGSLRTACTHQEDDTISMTIMRCHLFDLEIRGVGQTPILGLPTREIQASRVYKPKLFLYFREDLSDVDPEYDPVDGTLSVRLMDETSQTLTEAKVKVLARDVKNQFGLGNGYLWRKGKSMYSYMDRQGGYQFQVLCRSQADGKNLISKVFDCINKTPRWKFGNFKENEEPSSAYPTIPQRERILGKMRRLPRERPIATVRFQYAILDVWGLVQPIPLVDRVFRFKNPIERV
jgi:hypothetical protein